MLVRFVMTELVPYDCTGMTDQCSYHILLELHGQVEIGPGFVAIFQCRHLEDEVVDVFDVALALPFV